MPLVQVKLIKGVFDQDQKQEILTKMTETMVGIEGESHALGDDGHSSKRSRVASGRSAVTPFDPGRQGPPVGQVLTRAALLDGRRRARTPASPAPGLVACSPASTAPVTSNGETGDAGRMTA